MLGADPARTEDEAAPARSRGRVGVSGGAVVQIYNHHSLTDALLAALKPDLPLADVSGDQEEIGYPG